MSSRWLPRLACFTASLAWASPTARRLALIRPTIYRGGNRPSSEQSCQHHKGVDNFVYNSTSGGGQRKKRDRLFVFGADGAIRTGANRFTQQRRNTGDAFRCPKNHGSKNILAKTKPNRNIHKGKNSFPWLTRSHKVNKISTIAGK